MLRVPSALRVGGRQALVDDFVKGLHGPHGQVAQRVQRGCQAQAVFVVGAGHVLHQGRQLGCATKQVDGLAGWKVFGHVVFYFRVLRKKYGHKIPIICR